MTRTERIARMRRQLAEIRSAALRVQGEAYTALQKVDALAAEVDLLEREGEP